ncbi:AtpZ/AtpI family protein [Chloroflexota bacterium]
MIERVNGLTRNGIFVMLRGVSDIEAEMRRWVLAMRLTGVGFYIGACILGGVLAGLWIDGRLGTGPAFMVGGLVLGVIVAVYGVYQMLLPLLNDKENGERD